MDFYRQSTDVTPTSGSVPITSDMPVLALYVGGAGDLVVHLSKNAAGVYTTFKNVPAGTLLPLRVSEIRQTGTTATNILALW